MTRKFCDKCGDVIFFNPLQNAFLVPFKIKKLEGPPVDWRDIDLCPNCSNDFAEWLKQEKDQEDAN